MAFIEFKNIGKSYDGKTFVLKNLNLSIEKGDLATLLGPSGCGKSTLLRMLAGFEEVTEGQIFIDGKDISDLAPGKRGIGMVFQQYSLFPNMNVYENIAFGLKMAKIAPDEIDAKVKHMLEIVDLIGRENYYPNNLSGGQKQRVALARALVTEPSVLLLDEPLSAIDALLRKSLQKEIRDIQQKLNITTVFVTHDQDEAMVMSDIIHVMNKGVIEQRAVPTEMYTKPKTYFVASFMGNYNVLSPHEFNKMTGQNVDKAVAIRPEVIELVSTEVQPGEDYYLLRGIIVGNIITSNILTYYIDVNGVEVRADILYRSFNIHNDGESINIKILKRNCLQLEQA